MLVLGIDPGTASTGYGLVASDGARLRLVEHGVIETRAGVALELRLAQIHARVAELLDQHRPEVLAIEELYFGANVQTAFAVGQARGVVLLAAGQRGLGARSYTPQQVKAAVCGSGRAAKDQVGRMVARLLGLAAVPSPDHAADALAVAVAELNRAPLAELNRAPLAGLVPPAPHSTAARRPARAPAGRGVSAATLARARAGGGTRAGGGSR
jgi:crossover junction endodeoxyribonuclease RuvC